MWVLLHIQPVNRHNHRISVSYLHSNNDNNRSYACIMNESSLNEINRVGESPLVICDHSDESDGPKLQIRWAVRERSFQDSDGPGEGREVCMRA